MSGSSRSGFTWKEVANILCVSQDSNLAIFLREIKPPRKKVRIRTKRAPVGINDAQRTQSGAAPPSRAGARSSPANDGEHSARPVIADPVHRNVS